MAKRMNYNKKDKKINGKHKYSNNGRKKFFFFHILNLREIKHEARICLIAEILDKTWKLLTFLRLVAGFFRKTKGITTET